MKGKNIGLDWMIFHVHLNFFRQCGWIAIKYKVRFFCTVGTSRNTVGGFRPIEYVEFEC